MQVLDALVVLGLRTRITSAVLRDAAASVELLKDPTDDDVDRACMLLKTLSDFAAQGKHSICCPSCKPYKLLAQGREDSRIMPDQKSLLLNRP
jgi:hypothetical protein